MTRDAKNAPSRSGLDLTERQRIVLRAVVEDYVLNAVPVGSQALVERYGLTSAPPPCGAPWPSSRRWAC